MGLADGEGRQRMQEFATVILKRGEGRLMKSGGAWIFDNEIKEVQGAYTGGSFVRVEDFDGFPLGTGYINPKSKIRVRMLSRDVQEEINDDFFRKRFREALALRRRIVDLDCCRLVFGEADFLPGLTVDRYGDILVMEPNSLGIERMKERLAALLKEVLEENGLPVRGIYDRSDSRERTKEGLERTKGFLGEPFDTTVEIVENGVRYYVDVKDGQKTGFFLDQKYNRLAMQKFCAGADVLDCFTHTGSFALNAAFAGAKSVLGVDASKSAVEMAERNAGLKGFSNVRFEAADVLELLPEYVAAGKKFDVVILDPPAFAKAKSSVKNAARGYREINREGMKLVKHGGFLASCSCSHFMTKELFEDMLRAVAKEAHVQIRELERRAQSPDHPILWSAGDSEYLKFFIMQVL